MEKNVVTIDLERYDELVKAENKLENLKIIVENEKSEYGYTKETSKVIDGILGVTRE